MNLQNCQLISHIIHNKMEDTAKQIKESARIMDTVMASYWIIFLYKTRQDLKMYEDNKVLNYLGYE